MSDHYVCMGCGGHPDYSCYEHEGKFYCGPCFDNAKLESKNAELSALRAEVEGLRKKLADAESVSASRFAMIDAAADIARAAEAEVVRLNRMISDALLDPSEVARLRKVADAARECRERQLIAYGAEEAFAGVNHAERALDAALAGLGEPTPEPPSEL